MARFEYYGKGLPKVDLAELKGKLIVIEGTDGVGRSTHIGLLKQWLENNALQSNLANADPRVHTTKKLNVSRFYLCAERYGSRDWSAKG